MSLKALVTSKTGSFETAKTGVTTNLAASAITFKAAVGLGIITLPIHFANSGYVLGGFLIILISALILYALIIFLKLIDEVEKRNPLIQIKTPSEVALYVFKSTGLKKTFSYCKCALVYISKQNCQTTKYNT